jgi:hypothetical protein
MTTKPVAAVCDRRKDEFVVAAVYDRRVENDFDAHRAPLQRCRYKGAATKEPLQKRQS